MSGLIYFGVLGGPGQSNGSDCVWEDGRRETHRINWILTRKVPGFETKLLHK